MPCKHRWSTGSNYAGMEVRFCNKCTCHSFRFDQKKFHLITSDYLSSIPCTQTDQIVGFLAKYHQDPGEWSIAVDHAIRIMGKIAPLAEALVNTIKRLEADELTFLANDFELNKHIMGLNSRIAKLEAKRE